MTQRLRSWKLSFQGQDPERWKNCKKWKVIRSRGARIGTEGVTSEQMMFSPGCTGDLGSGLLSKFVYLNWLP